MNDAQLLRYSRHIMLDAIGIEGQQRLLDAHVLVIGAGGLGSPVLMYLGSAGVGHITVVDHDTVDATNLQRQVAHTESRVGLAKVESAAQAIAAINSDVRVTTIQQRADADLLSVLVAHVDLVIDCCDNYATRQAVNAACVRHRKPLVSGAAIGFDGQISVWDTRSGQLPCYACVFSPEATVQEVACATMGVFAPLVGIIGTMQAAEALKVLVGCGDSLAGRLLMLDGMNMEWTEVRVARDAACPVCGSHHLPASPA
ncbi:MAG: hypothetical protein RL375_2029 [Pseudomonadota bacterium]